MKRVIELLRATAVCIGLMAIALTAHAHKASDSYLQIDAGDKVMGIFGWQDYSAVKQPQVMRKVQEADLPLSLSLGILGLNGLTAYFGLLDVCRH